MQRTELVFLSIAGLAMAGSVIAAAPKAPGPVSGPLPSGNILFWPLAQRPAGFTHMERIFSTAVVQRGPRVRTLAKAPREMAVRYAVAGKPMDAEAFMAANNVGGLLVLQDGKIALERYRFGFGPELRWTSFSTAKSVTSTLVGAAIRDGHITSVDDPVVRYIPKLAGSAYDKVTLRQLLTMSSGTRWNEDYEDPKSDASKLKAVYDDPKGDIVAYMAALPREVPAGTRFHYNTGDSNLLGIAVANATGTPLARYLSEKIWAPYGMEADAAWVQVNGQALGGSSLSMRLRDFGRFGQFFLDGGMIDGRPVLPDGWRDTAAGALLPTGWGDIHYGYQWWTRRDGTFRALGIFGQMIFVDPKRRLVVVALSAWPHADADANYAVEDAFLAAVQAAAG
jgi:CubicO group peptidase (beta-lactamase class C family)